MLDVRGIARGVCVRGTAHGLDNPAILGAAARHPSRLRVVGITDASVSAGTLRDWRAQGTHSLRVHL
jgi:hypothetical protein